MPTTRSQAHRGHGSEAPRRGVNDDDDEEEEEDAPRARERDTDDEDDDPEEGSDDADDEEEQEELASMVRARSEIVYDIKSLAMESRARALAGLTGRFNMVYCREAPGLYEFQLAERPLIRMQEGAAECTCSEYENRPSMACRHIFWLVDRLYGSISPQTPPPGLPLSKDGFSPRLPRMDTLLQDRLEAVADNLQWPYFAGSTRSPDASSPESGGMAREDKVRDILSSFNKITLPEDFRRDLAETTNQPRTPEQCVVQGDLEATLFRLAVHDDNVYTSFRKAMPAGACAAIYFDKAQTQSRDLLVQFDEYRRSGRMASGRHSLEVKDVAKQMRQIVRRIQTNLTDRVPHGTKGAAEALITLLQDISARNIDAFDNSPWDRRPRPGEDEDDRNLYEQLIGQTDEAEGLFVLDALDELPASVLGQYLPRLQDILGKIEINRAPAPYVLKLKQLIHETQTTDSASSRPKRPATGQAGGSQKRTR